MPATDAAARHAAPSRTTARWRRDHDRMLGIGELTDRECGHSASRRRLGLYVTLHRRSMHVLLLRPVPGNERFGLGPFFRIEPLGMEYIASALEAAVTR